MKAAPQSTHPDPADDADLLGPADRMVEHVAEDDLQEEGRRTSAEQQRDGDVLGAPAQPARRSRCTCLIHRSLATIARRDEATRDESPAGDQPAMPDCAAGAIAQRVYLIALMRSSAPFGQSLPYLSRYFFCAKVRKAFEVGRVDLLAFLLEELDRAPSPARRTSPRCRRSPCRRRPGTSPAASGVMRVPGLLRSPSARRSRSTWPVRTNCVVTS